MSFKTFRRSIKMLKLQNIDCRSGNCKSFICRRLAKIKRISRIFDKLSASLSDSFAIPKWDYTVPIRDVNTSKRLNVTPVSKIIPYL